MKVKLIILAASVGLLVSVLFIVISSSKQIAHYEGFNEATKSDFVYSQNALCAGVNYSVYKSIRGVGYPIKSKVTTNFNDCIDVGTHSTTDMLVKSVTTLNFYINWLIWSAVAYAILFLLYKISSKSVH